ncbi:hypothetical protein FQA39_LY01522 [Lamprigera yunnana]|nr:hypothetical protein FQA39_LY01522 [Lamprigera yunnana]
MSQIEDEVQHFRSYLSKQMHLLSFNDKKKHKVIVHDITCIDNKGQITKREINSRNNERQKHITLNPQHNSEDVSNENIDGYTNVPNFENCAIDNNYEDDN